MTERGVLINNTQCEDCIHYSICKYRDDAIATEDIIARRINESIPIAECITLYIKCNEFSEKNKLKISNKKEDFSVIDYRALSN